MEQISGPDREGTRSAASIALLCDLANDLGRPSGDLLKAAGVSREELADPATMVTARQELAAIEKLLAGPDDPSGLGLRAGTRYQLTTYGIWSFALLSSATFRDALDIALSHVGLTFACTNISANDSEGSLRLTFADWPVAEPLREFVLARDTIAGLGIIRGTLDAALTPQRVQLALPAPQDPKAFTEAFGLSVEFDAPKSVLTFDRGLLDRPMPQASELTARMCLAQCRELLDQRAARHGLSGRVRDLLVSDPRRMPGQEEIAAELHLSVRSLRRHLEEEGTGFRELVEQTRRALAEDLLLTEGLTVDQVAYRVGYSDTSAFVHAFRRWNGDAPRRWARERAAR